MCTYKLLKQDIAKLQKLHFWRSRDTTFVCNWFLSCGCTTWSGIQRLSHIVCTAPTFPQNGNHVHVHKFTKVTKAQSHLTHPNVFLIRFVVHVTLKCSTHRPSSSCWNVSSTCAASFYGWRYFCCYFCTHVFPQRFDTGNALLHKSHLNISKEIL